LTSLTISFTVSMWLPTSPTISPNIAIVLPYVLMWSGASCCFPTPNPTLSNLFCLIGPCHLRCHSMSHIVVPQHPYHPLSHSL
jgi:hypothetical protein